MSQRLQALLDAVADRITSLVGTMYCALAFALLAALSLPAAIGSGNALVIVGWVAQTFLQLVLLPVIMVGQTRAGASTERLIRETHDAVLGSIGHVHRTVAAVHECVASTDTSSRE